jgi:16S rRNA (guanine1207-N2)-methyltransferase
MSSEHYFSETPATEYKPKLISAVLNGREFRLETAGGVFSPDHIDQGTSVLLEHLAQAPVGGNLLDVGCGWGPIAISLALAAPRATVWAIDVNERSLELTRRNAEIAGVANLRVCRPEEVPNDIEFSGIWSNPPIRVGKEALHEILRTWLPRLAANAESYLVVQKNLGADSLHRWLEATLPEGFSTIRVDTAKSFRVLRVKNRA